MPPVELSGPQKRELRLARIPTLIRFAGGCEVGRLVEADCGKPAAVEAFLA